MDSRIGKLTRLAVEMRAKERCEYCLSPADLCPESFSVEHIVPRSRGGSDDLSNLALSCQGCNNHKYNRIEAVDPASNVSVPLFNPRFDIWTEHFGWNEDDTLVIGRTPVGRATVNLLHLNRRGVVNLRHLMKQHPRAYRGPSPESN